MAKKASKAQLKMGSVSKLPNSHTRSAEIATSTDELQQVQELLFGSQAREIDNNLQALEQRFDERLDAMRQSYEAQIQALNDVIAVQAKKESAARLAGYKALAIEIESVRAHAGDTIADLQEQQRQLKKTSSDNLDAAMTKLEAQWEKKSSKLASDVWQKHDALDKSKVNKKVMSKLLSNLATELG